MDHEDFDFPPDLAVEALDCVSDTFNNIPLRVLANTPIEQLPPTILPPGQRPAIKQLLRSNREPRRRAILRQRAESSDLLLQSHRAMQARGAADSEGSAPPTKKPFASRKRCRFNWSEEELREFYEFLSQYGTDFNAIAVMYPGRSREDVKRLYHRELRKRGDDVQRALAVRGEIDLGAFKARLRRRTELRRGPTRQLDQEEEETLRLIETGALEPQPASGEDTRKEKINEDVAEGASGEVNVVDNDFAFDAIGVESIAGKDPREAKSEEKACGDEVSGAVGLVWHEKCSNATNASKTDFLDNTFASEFAVTEEELEDDLFWD